MDGIGMTPALYKRNELVQKAVGMLRKFCPRFTYSLIFGKQNSKELVSAMGNRGKWLDACYNVLSKEFESFVKGYQFVPPEETNCKKVWVCWLQGEENMPEVVRICIDSIKQNVPKDYSVEFVDNTNLREWVDIPQRIYDLLHAGKLRPAYFSDIVRMRLLSQYGGIWIDSTVFVSAPIPDDFFEKRLYSIQAKDEEHRSEDLYYGALTSFLIGGSNQCPLFDFLYNFFITYSNKHWILIDGHLINIAFRIAYENNIGGIREDINNIGVNNANRNLLFLEINKPFNEEQWVELTNHQIFHKMNWRTKYLDDCTNQKTFYYHLKEDSRFWLRNEVD